jgi:hypothetical protein
MARWPMGYHWFTWRHDQLIMPIKDEKEFLAIAMKAYDNPSCVDITEFESDLRKIQYCKKLLRKYHTDGEPTFRLLLNNLIIFYNLFGTPGTDMLLYKIKEEELRQILIPIVMYLGHANESLLSLSINIDESIIDLLSPTIIHER